jgi:hypothetical protein
VTGQGRETVREIAERHQREIDAIRDEITGLKALVRLLACDLGWDVDALEFPAADPGCQGPGLQWPAWSTVPGTCPAAPHGTPG